MSVFSCHCHVNVHVLQAMFYYNNKSVRQAYISQLHKSFNSTFEKHNSAQNSISYQNLNKYTL